MDYLRKSQALQDCWQTPITGEQLQAEMDRMALRTKRQEVLRELFETLGNDIGPFCFEYRRCVLRAADPNAYSHANTDTYFNTKTYTHTTVTPNSASAALTDYEKAH